MLEHLKSRAYQLARSGTFFGWRPLEFELRFERGFSEARDWLRKPTTRESLTECAAKRERHGLMAGQRELPRPRLDFITRLVRVLGDGSLSLIRGSRP
jgi:hypothetical protein